MSNASPVKIAAAALLLFLYSLPTSTFAQNPELSEMQNVFLEGYQAIKANDRPAIAQAKMKLQNYSLYPYILYHDYRLHLKNTPPHLITGFIQKYEGTYLSRFLYQKWLVHLAKTHQWQTFAKVYKPQKKQDLQCLNIQAQAHLKQNEEALKHAQLIWKSATQLSQACHPIDALLKKHRKLTGSMIWQRIKLAMNKHQISLAKKIAKQLSKHERKMLDYWLKVYKKPSLVQKVMPKSITPSIRKMIFTQGITLFAAQSPALAKQSLNRYRQQYGLNRDQYQILDRKIALKSAYQYAPQAKTLLNGVNTKGAKTQDTLRWQAQIALKHSDWSSLLDTIELMSDTEQESTQWLYWKARALEATQQTAEANDLYKLLARQRHYYAFLSADRLNKPYQFNPRPIIEIKTDALIQKYPELRRIQELLAIDWLLSSKREWYQLLNKIDRDELQAVAVLANQWQQHTQAIRSLAKAKTWDALSLRFPTPYKEPVMQNAKKNDIDAAWIYGIMRRESGFSEDIRSSVGATGLMQLMPKTAKYMSKKLGSKNLSYKHLTQAENNIELGSAYLKYLNEKFNGNKVLATAAYNAGPNRIEKWIPQLHSLPADQWIDAIPYSETRDYVKAVLEYTTIFKSLLNQKYDRLNDVMPDIGGKADSKTP